MDASLKQSRAADRSPELSGSALPVKTVSIDRHPTEASSAIVALRIGELELAFNVEANELLQSVKRFLETRRSASKHDPDR